MSKNPPKFRFANGTEVKDRQLSGIAATQAMWECSNFLACSSKHIIIPWLTEGACVVLPTNYAGGKMPGAIPLIRAHKGNVLDMAFSPFDDDLVFTSGEDCTAKGWRIPEGGITEHQDTPLITLASHTKKVGILSWHPSAANVLATVGYDNQIKIWDVEKSTAAFSYSLPDVITGINWNLDGSMICGVTKDKKISLLDSRTGTVIASADAHVGSKAQRCVWAKKRDLIITVGSNKNQYRQAMVWDPRQLQKPIHVEEVDQGTSAFMPFYDEDTSVLFLGGRGDSSIRTYEVMHEGVPLTPCAQYQSKEEQKGLAMMPKRCMNFKACEIARFWKLSMKSFTCVSYVMPRKGSQFEFQDDIFVPTFANAPALTAEEYVSGVNKAPNESDLRPLFEGSGQVEVRQSSLVGSGVTEVQSPTQKTAEPEKATTTTTTTTTTAKTTPNVTVHSPQRKPAEQTVTVAPLGPSQQEILAMIADLTKRLQDATALLQQITQAVPAAFHSHNAHKDPEPKEEKPVAEQKADEKPVAEQKADEKPVAEQKADEKPANEKPVETKTASDATLAVETSSNDNQKDEVKADEAPNAPKEGEATEASSEKQ